MIGKYQGTELMVKKVILSHDMSPCVVHHLPTFGSIVGKKDYSKLKSIV